MIDATTHLSTGTHGADELARPEWLPRTEWPFDLRRYEHPRPDAAPLSIHYTDEGSGPVLVFVHAGMWSFIWRDAIAALRSEFRCIALDFPGAGLSGGTRHDVDLAVDPAIVTGLLDHCGVDRATFVVHDLGGVVGVLAAADQPARAVGLVATNSFAWPPGPRSLKAMLRIVGSRPATALLGSLGVVPRMTRTRFGVGRHFDRADRAAFFGPYRQRARSRNFHRAMRSARTSIEMFEQAERALRSTLSGIPVLTVFGKRNDPFGFAPHWAELFPDASSWVVEGGYHFPMCDDPEGYVTRLRTWHHDAVAP